MNNNYSKIEKISNEGYQLEFGTVLENAFNNYKKIAGIGGLSLLIISIIAVILFGGFLGAIYGFSDFASTLTGLNPDSMTGNSLLYFFIFSIVIAGIFSPINAGFITMAHLADKNQPFGIETVFSYYKGNYFKELFLSGVIIAFVGAGISYLLEFFHVSMLGNLFTYVISFLTILTIPLIIFSDLTAIQSITMSIKLVLKQPLLLFGLLLVSVLFACIGIFGFCIGLLFTLPFLYSMYYCIYTAIVPVSEKTELDEIGQNQE